MRAAIITIAYGENYGNRLQNYAMQETLKGLGLEAVTIRHQLTVGETGFKKLLRPIKNSIKRILGRPYGRCRSLRAKRFKVFNRNNVAYSKEVFGINTAPDSLNHRYDFFIVGSDQVWNTEFGDISSNINIFLASFADGSKRIAYAASFGTNHILKQYENLFKAELPKFKAVSVREASGIPLVESCGAEATVALDPTMMLTPQSWDKLAKKPKYADDSPFIVTYFLGGRSRALEEFTEAVADGRKVYHLEWEGMPEDQIKNLDIYLTTPDEFVWLIAHADCVLTDSFHGSVFSILYHRPFMVFDRLVDGKKSGMESRIDTLLSTFHLEQCRGDINNPNGEPVGGDWDEVDRILSAEREKSLEYLKNALDIKE